MRANVKPFVHWAIYKGYTVRFHSRTPQRVTGILTMPGLADAGPVQFEYDPGARRILLPAGPVQINEHGWEIEPDARPASADDPPTNESSATESSAESASRGDPTGQSST